MLSKYLVIYWSHDVLLTMVVDAQSEDEAIDAASRLGIVAGWENAQRYMKAERLIYNHWHGF